MNTLESIKQWFEIAKPEPTLNDLSTQIGCHYEEVSEMASNLEDEDLSFSLEEVATTHKIGKYLSQDLMRGKPELIEKLTDDLCDQIVTAIGIGHMLGVDIVGALAEVNRSNWSKFENGKPVLKENGKIAKGKDYTPPNLSEYVR